MAAKKTTTTTKKTTTTTSTPKKTTRAKKIKLTYNPIFSASRSFTAYLAKDAEKIISGKSVVTKEPMIQGLPEVLTVKKGEVIEVTKAQYTELLNLGLVESEEDREARIQREKEIKSQFPDKLTNEQLANPTLSIGSVNVSGLYRDKLYIVWYYERSNHTRGYSIPITTWQMWWYKHRIYSTIYSGCRRKYFIYIKYNWWR